MMEDRQIRVGVNATALMSPRTGIGQYVYALGKELLIRGDVHPRFFYMKNWSDSLRETPLANIATLKSRIIRYVPNAYVVSRVLAQTCFSSGVLREPVDLYHEPNYLAYRFRGPTVITVHDLSWIRHPETHPKERLKAMDRYFPRSLERASAILTDCNFVKQELVEVFGVNPSLIHPVLLGASPGFRPYSSGETQDVMTGHNLQHGRYFLTVGTLEPRKNIVSIIDAYSKLPTSVQESYPLVLVGMRGWLTSSIEERMRPLVEKGFVRPLGYVADDQMPLIYSGAAAFLFPSLYEGFGLPPLEAMACGVPVIASNRSSLPEVVGDAGMLLDPLDVDAMAEAMQEILENRILANDLAKKGIVRAKRFTWHRTAEETVAVYRKVLGV